MHQKKSYSLVTCQQAWKAKIFRIPQHLADRGILRIAKQLLHLLLIWKVNYNEKLYLCSPRASGLLTWALYHVLQSWAQHRNLSFLEREAQTVHLLSTSAESYSEPFKIPSLVPPYILVRASNAWVFSFKGVMSSWTGKMWKLLSYKLAFLTYISEIWSHLESWMLWFL